MSGSARPTPTFTDRYTVQRELGRGATSTVYLASDATYSRLVAIKVLRPELAQSIGADRFLREIRLTAQLHHPNIVQLLDSGEQDDMLYFVLPYLDGGTLRDRLERERQLPLDEAIGIARTIALALDYAHERGLVHRDVKPENILFTGGVACLADFGIARALERGTGETTSTGIVRGTPAYMSPEQAGGDKAIDGRSDLYSLACVLYEMVTGMTPFVGPTPQSVMAQRITVTPRPASLYRSTVTPELDAALERAMAVAPADRFPRAKEFADALGVADRTSVGYAPRALHAVTAGPIAVRRKRLLRRLTTAGAVAVLSAVAVVIYRQSDTRGAQATVMDVDNPRIAVALLSAATPALSDSVESEIVRGVVLAASRWSDARVTALSQTDNDSREGWLSAALRGTKQAGGHWLVVLEATRKDDSIALNATLWDTQSRRDVGHATRVVPTANRSVPAMFTGLIAELFGAREIDAPPERADGGPTFRAWRDFVRAKNALRNWRVDSAERLLESVLRTNPQFSPAAVYLSQIRVWRRQEIGSGVKTAATRGLDSDATLSRRDNLLARAALSLSEADFPVACAAYGQLRDLDSLDAVAWLGLGQCHTQDRAVVRDRRAAGGFRFRSSYQRGVDAYVRAAQIDARTVAFLAPSIGSGPLFTSTNRIVVGSALPPDTLRFGAHPYWDLRGDTVALVPFPLADLISGRPHPAVLERDAGVDRMIERHRGLLLRETRLWVRAAPEDPSALEALAVALELRGELLPDGPDTVSAIRALQHARRFAVDPAQRFRLAAAAVRLDVKAGRFAHARATADSLLVAAEAGIDGKSPAVLASLAALVGRGGRATHWLLAGTSAAGAPEAFDSLVPPQARREVAALLTWAAVGQCDSAAVALARSEAAIERFVPPTRYQAAWQAAMPRALSLMTRCDGGAGVLRVARPSDRLVAIQQAYGRRQFESVRAQIDSLEDRRRADRPGDVSLDYTLQEAWLLAQIGDSTRALKRLRQTLETLPTLGRDFLEQMPQAAAMCGVLDLTSRLAAKLGEIDAARDWDNGRVALCNPAR